MIKASMEYVESLYQSKLDQVKHACVEDEKLRALAEYHCEKSLRLWDKLHGPEEDDEDPRDTVYRIALYGLILGFLMGQELPETDSKSTGLHLVQ